MSHPDRSDLEHALAEASAALDRQDVPAADALCRRIIEFFPHDPRAWHLWAMAAHFSRDRHAAAQRLRQTVALDPRNADAQAQLGETLRQLGSLDEALAPAIESTKLNPQGTLYWYNLGNLYLDRREPERAEPAFRQSIIAAPQWAPGWLLLGKALVQQAKRSEAFDCFHRCTQLDPRRWAAWAEMGTILAELDQLTKAEQAYQTALQMEPNDPDLNGLLANLLLRSGRIEEAIAQHRRVLQLAPEHSIAEGNLLQAMNYSDRIGRQELFDAHREWGARFERQTPPRTVQRSPRGGSRIRLGYVSADFRDHAVWKWIEPVLAHHNRQRFELIAYSTRPRAGEPPFKARSYFDLWRDIAGITDDHAAEQVIADQIDILIDLGGHTANNRLGLFARKPAPMQLTWLGYPNTTGLNRIDYLITDDWIDPPGQTEHFYTERLLRLPRCFSCYRPPDEAPEVAELPASGAGRICFGSFNALRKLSSRTIALWAAVLQRVPDSRLLIKSGGAADPAVAQRLLSSFAEREIDPSRVELMPVQRSPREHLALYGRIDVALDTFPYHGTTTTADALWMGVPVVTRKGDTRAARIGVSLLNNAGLPECIAKTDEQFMEAAAQLAGDRTRLASLRAGMRKRLLASPLLDAATLTADLETALLNVLPCRG